MPSETPRVPPFTIGGQAVIEGVMMRSPAAIATAVRKPDGEIEITHRPFRGITAKLRFLNLPILRGGVNLIETLYLGMQSLSWSAEQAMDEEERPKQESRDWKSTLALVLPMVLAFVAGIGLFFYVPLLLTEWTGVRNGIAFNLVDGVFRLVIFLIYIWAISLWKEMGRVFQYHGAEHKSIFVFETACRWCPRRPSALRRSTRAAEPAFCCWSCSRASSCSASWAGPKPWASVCSGWRSCR